MNIIQNTCSEIFKIPDCQDYGEDLDYTINYYVADRANSTEYFLDDLVLPATKSGVYLQCVQPGISASSAPTISTKKGARTTDGTVIWKTIPGRLALQSGETVVSSSWDSNIPTELTHSGITDFIKVGETLTGATSGAIGTIELTSTSEYIFVRNITGTFQTEVVSTSSGSATITAVGSIMATVSDESFTDSSTTAWLSAADTRLTSAVLVNTITTSSTPVRTIEENIEITFK